MSLTRAAAAQGLLAPLEQFLEKELDDAIKPMEVEGAEWPYKRAEMDGYARGIVEVIRWVRQHSKPSPDGAQNTED